MFSNREHNKNNTPFLRKTYTSNKTVLSFSQVEMEQKMPFSGAINKCECTFFPFILNI